MTPREARIADGKLKELIYQRFLAKDEFICEHVWNCIKNGVSIPLFRIYWDEKLHDIIVEVVNDLKSPAVSREELRRIVGNRRR